FADEADALAAVDHEADAVDGPKRLGLDRWALAEQLAKTLAKPLCARARIFLHQLLDHQERPRSVAAVARSRHRSRGGVLLGQQVAQRHAGPWGRAHEPARIGMRGSGEDRF